MTKGFRHDPLADINMIRDNLRDRYKNGFPVIKELVQNANDALATQLDIGWVKNVPEADHLLLKGPALFVINNGPFKNKDAKAIREMGLSNKMNERSSIGRFGLGLKSIFHLCEAFFYLSSENYNDDLSLGTSDFPRTDLLNPWSGAGRTSSHQDWDFFSPTSQQRMKHTLQGLLAHDPWFCLWIPLRKKEHSPYPIMAQYPGDSLNPPDSVLIPGLEIHLANLIPMLTHIKTIQGWCQEGGKSELKNKFRITIAKSSITCSYPELKLNEPSKINGEIIVESSEKVSAKWKHVFGGLELLFENPELNGLKESDYWPRYSGTDQETGEAKHEFQKADPHCAVCFIKHPVTKGNKGSLSISWSVFLPVGDVDDVEVLNYDGNSDFLISLHGYFFLDAGRARIDFGADQDFVQRAENERSIRCAWNRLLAERGTLPLLLPALDHFFHEAGLREKEIYSLTELIERSQFFKKYRKDVCRDYQWIHCLTVSGEQWQLLDSSKAVLLLPRPPESDPQRHFEVFPQLVNLCSSQSITFRKEPRLSPSAFSGWTEPLVLEMLHLPIEDVFRSQGRIEYFNQFLENCCGEAPIPDSISKRLFEILHKAFKLIPLTQLRRNKSHIQKILHFVPPGRRLVLGRDHGEALDLVLEELLKLTLSVLLLPRDFDIEVHKSSGSFTSDDACAIFARLSTIASEKEGKENISEILSQVALHILDSDLINREVIQERCGNLKLFQGYDCSKNEKVSLSLMEMIEIKRTGTLFIFSPPPRPYGLSRQLQESIKGGKVLLIERETARILFGEKEASPCTVYACLEFLKKRPPLTGATEKRAGLLSQLLEKADGISWADQRRSLRYLMHGRGDQFENESTLLVRQFGGEHPVWVKIVQKALETSKSEWRVIHEDLSNAIAGEHWERLGLSAVNNESVIRIIREMGPQNIGCGGMTAEERKIIFRETQDLDVLKKLQIHETINGKLVAIGEKTYLQDDFRLDEIFLNGIDVIRPYDNDVLLAKQRNIIHGLDAKAVIQILLEQDHLKAAWPVLIEALGRIGEDIEADSNLVKILREKAWLLTIDGTRVKPEDVIYIETLKEEVSRVVSTTHGLFVDGDLLSKGIHDHPAFNILTKYIFPNMADALLMLGVIMGQEERYRIGDFETNKFPLEDFLIVFDNAPSELIPAFPIIKGVCEKISPEACKANLLPNILKALPFTRTVSILKLLSNEHKSSSVAQKVNFLRMANFYLENAARRQDFLSILEQIELLNRRNRWKKCSELCINAEGIDKAELLDVDQGNIIKNVIGEPGTGEDISSDEGTIKLGSKRFRKDEIENVFRISAAALRNYFLSWEGSIPRETIGGFLCLLGDYPGIRSLAENYLGNRNIESVRERLAWEPIKGIQPWGVEGEGEDVRKVMEKQRFFVEIIESDTIKVPSILGTKFRAKISEEFDNLYIGAEPDPLWGTGFRTNLIRLRKVDPNDFGTERLSRLLLTSSKILLERVYLQKSPNLEQIWNDIFHSEQLDIKIAENLILESAFFYLKQLGFRTTEKIKQVVSQWEEARRRKAEEEQAQASGQKIRSSGDEGLRNARKELRELILSDSDARAMILGDIREKLGNHFQYRNSSIPFELFQNADDAAIELDEMEGESGIPSDRKKDKDCFVACWDRKKIVFIHWGRCVNQYRLGSFNGRERGFDRDLEKMLVLFSSDKSGRKEFGQEKLTGKFGLGFKSVFLVTDSPKIISGQLGFEIIGGMIPQRLPGEEYKRLRDQINGSSPDQKGATLFELSLKEDVIHDTVLRDFQKFANILLAFSKRIKRCECYSGNDRPDVIEWAEKSFFDSKRVYSGEMVIGTERDKTMALVIRGTDGSFLLAIGTREFRRISEDVPSFWVTAPTREYGNLGFVVNGAFDLDIGRAQLARDSTCNKGLAKELGIDIGEALCEIFDRSVSDWTGFCETLRLAEDTKPYNLWESLWNLFAAPFDGTRGREKGGSVDLARAILWESDLHGMRRLLLTRRALPSGLWGEYRTLASIKDFTFSVSGSLEAEEVFNKAAKLKVFRERIPPGKAISNSRIGVSLSSILPSAFNWGTVDLCQILEWEIGEDKKVDPQKASLLGDIITSGFLLRLKQGSESQSKEHERLVDYLKTLSFLGQDDKYHPANELLIATDDSSEYRDEKARTHFAPENRILDGNYIDISLSFFKACRQQLTAPAKEMAEWALNAKSRDRRIGVFKYLLEGELGSHLAGELRNKMNGSWLEEIENSEYLQRFNINEKNVILGRLGLHPELPPPPPPLDTSRVLNEIYSWWSLEGNEWISKYERRVYPGKYLECLPILCTDSNVIRGDARARKNWLVLLFLGALHTMGRTKQGQHLEFIKNCDDQGWLDIFASPKSVPEDWIRVLDEYFDKQVEESPYYEWMKQFVGIYGISRRIEDYADLFLGINKIKERFPLDEILRSKASARSQGGGTSAPPLSRILGMGTCFVVRELVRQGIINSKVAYRYCYVPVGRVRKLLLTLGCDGLDLGINRWEISSQIYEFLKKYLGEEKAIFQKAFDLPLLAVAEDINLQYRFLKEALPGDDEEAD